MFLFFIVLFFFTALLSGVLCQPRLFADIFYNNCFKNGILPIRLPQDQVETLTKQAQQTPEKEMTVDLESQTITAADGQSF